MTPRRTRRDRWRRTKKGTWTCSIGFRGCRVWLFEMTKGGYYYRAVHILGRGKNRVSLGTPDRAEAERLGRAFLAALVGGAPAKVPTIVRLGELIDAFVTESPMFLDNANTTKADARTRVAILRAVLGGNTDVRALTEHHLRQ